jgi:hypothetical protein
MVGLADHDGIDHFPRYFNANAAFADHDVE